MNIAELDANFSIPAKITDPDCVFYDIKKEPFEIFGLYNPRGEGSFKRMPREIADKVNGGVSWLSGDTSGGRVRFSTNSKYVAIRVKMPYLVYPHQSLLGSAGFTLFIDGENGSKYYKSFVPPTRYEDGWQAMIWFADNERRDITIYFPLYCHVDKVEIGVNKNSAIEKNKYKYRDIKPVLYYGGSHVQGGCASVPSNSYPAFISRWTNTDFINLCFSGSAMGEKEMAKYIAGQDMSVLVMEYDHNAPTPEHLRKTHYEFYKVIRDKNPDLPIIFVSKHDFYTISYYVKTQRENEERRQIIIDNFNRAKSEGDRNIYFIDGKTILGDVDNDVCTVDGTHPNDLGFYKIAETVCPVIKNILKI